MLRCPVQVSTVDAFPRRVILYVRLQCISMQNGKICRFTITYRVTPKRFQRAPKTCTKSGNPLRIVFLAFFPACQVRVVRFYFGVQSPLPSPPPPAPPPPPPPATPPPPPPPRPPVCAIASSIGRAQK